MMVSSGELSIKEESEKIRYMGSGDDAIIRPGVVLVAPVHEYDHFLMRSAVFVNAIGLDEQDNVVIRGVVIDHPTAFTIGEMSPNVMGKLSDNLLFRGGYDGSDTAMMLHSAGGYWSHSIGHYDWIIGDIRRWDCICNGIGGCGIDRTRSMQILF